MVKEQSQEDIMKAILFSQKVAYSACPPAPLLTNPPPGSIHRSTPLGRLSHIHSRLYRLPLHPNLCNSPIPQILLCDPCNQHLLLRRHRPCRLPYLSTFILSMGSHDRRKWILRGPEISGPLHWHFQSPPRCNGRRITDAGPLGFEVGRGEESDIERHVWHGYCVCPALLRLRLLSSFATNIKPLRLC